jgi:hypothetical protein
MKILLAYVLLFIHDDLLKAQQMKKIYKTIANTTVYKDESKKLYTFTGAMMIDADGSPKAYHKDDKQALDNLSNGGEPGNWWALVTDNNEPSGTPLIQTSSDPAPGYYIAMTSLENRDKDHGDPARYVNAEVIPYVVVPAGFSNDFKLGDIALVYNKHNGRKCFAIYADVGPKELIGEGSIKLAKELGINSSPKNGGVETGVTYILLIGSGQGKMLTREEIDAIGQSRLSGEDIKTLIENAE